MICLRLFCCCFISHHVASRPLFFARFADCLRARAVHARAFSESVGQPKLLVFHRCGRVGSSVDYWEGQGMLDFGRSKMSNGGNGSLFLFRWTVLGSIF